MGTNRPTTPQSITVEYTVTGSLDGVSPAPVVQIDQTRDDATPFDQVAQIYRPPAVERLGLIDPDLLVGGSIGTRCVPFLSLDTTEVGAAGASVDIVGVRGSPSDVFFQKQIEDLVGDAGPIYLDGGFNVPQGSDIRVRGYTAAPGEPIRVRVTLLVPDSCLDVAAFHCPCPNGNGPPPPVDAGCLGRFLVATDPDCAPYTSIQVAYQAAKDAGHGYGNVKGPAQVLVCPGDYDENVLLDTAGIDVIAVAKNPTGENATAQTFGQFPAPVPGETRLAGTVTVNFAATGGEPARASWQGIDIVPESGPCILFTGPNPKLFKLNDCIVQAADNNAIVMDSSALGPDANQMDVRNVSIGTEGVAFPFLAVAAIPGAPGAQHLFRTWNTNISVPFATTAVMQMVQAEVVFDDTIVTGQIQVVDTLIVANDSRFQATQETSAVGLDANSLMISVDCKFAAETEGGSFVSGDGLFIHDSVTLLGDLDWPTTLFVLTTQGIPQEQHWTFVDLDAIGTFTISGESNILAGGPALPGPVLELPSSLMRPGPIRIIEDGQPGVSAGPVTVSVSTAFPGDLIVVGTDPPAATVTLPRPGAGSSGGYMFVSNGAGRWYAMCFCQGGAAANCLTEALVSPDPALAPFQLIQDAYDFLVGLGADEVNPAKVLVCPGEYLEDVSMTQAGIDIVACAQDPYNELRPGGVGITRLAGTLTLALSGAVDPTLNSCAWRGIDLVPGGCVATGSQISTPTGLRPVEALEAGDVVWSVDPKNGERHETKIRSVTTSKRECMSLSAAGRTMICTPSHRVYSPEAGAFHQAARWGDGLYTELLATPEGAVEAVEATVESYAGMHDVYDLSVESEHHTFVVDGFVVHNKTSALIFTLDELQFCRISDCLVRGTGADPGLLGNNPVPGSSLDCIRVALTNDDVNSASGFEWLGGSLLLSDCMTRGQNRNQVGPDGRVVATGSRFNNGTEVGSPALSGGVLEATDCSFGGSPSFAFVGPGPALGIIDLLRCDTALDPVIGDGLFLYDSVPTSSPFGTVFDGITTTAQNASIPQGAPVVELTGAGPHVLTGAETNVIVTTPLLPGGPVLVTLPTVPTRMGALRIKPNPETPSATHQSVDILTILPETINTVLPPFALPAAGATFASWSRPGPPADDWETYG